MSEAQSRGLFDFAGQLQGAGDRLGAAGTGVNGADPGLRAFGGNGPGRLGELGREMHKAWLLALDSRGREAALHGSRFSDTGDRLRGIGEDIRDVEDGVTARHREVGYPEAPPDEIREAPAGGPVGDGPAALAPRPGVGLPEGG